jgi:hypothetical protein
VSFAIASIIEGEGIGSIWRVFNRNTMPIRMLNRNRFWPNCKQKKNGK